MTELEAKLTQTIAEMSSAHAEAMASLTTTINRLTARVEELSARLNRDSSNSSKPPSSNAPGVNLKRSPPRKPSGRKPGGQPGHTGHQRQSLTADEVFDVLASQCPCCDAVLDASTVIDEPSSVHQVVELATGSVVTDYHVRTHLCGCGAKVRARLPRSVPNTATGPKLQAAVTTLIGKYGLSRVDAQQAIDEFFGVKLSVGAIHEITERAAAATQAAVDDIGVQLAAAGAKHCDETGWRHRGNRAWVWVVCSAIGAMFRIDENRSRAAFERLLPHLQGVIHTDRWRVYDIIEAELRQLCHAHLRRDIQALIDLGAATNELGALLLEQSDRMFHHWHQFVAGETDRPALLAAMEPVQAQWRALLTLASTHNHRKARALGKDLLRQWASLWTFLRQEQVEPTNNRAERVIRPTVLIRKTNGGTASDAGKAFVANLQSVFVTARCQGIDALTWIEQALAAHLSGAPAPMLLPTPTG